MPMITVRAWLAEHDILPPLTKVTAHHELRQKQGESREKKSTSVFCMCSYTQTHTYTPSHLQPAESEVNRVLA